MAIAVLVDQGIKSLFDVKKVLIIGKLPHRLEFPFSQLIIQIRMIQGKLPLQFMCIKEKIKLIVMETYCSLLHL